MYTFTLHVRGDSDHNSGKLLFTSEWYGKIPTVNDFKINLDTSLFTKTTKDFLVASYRLFVEKYIIDNLHNQKVTLSDDIVVEFSVKLDDNKAKVVSSDNMLQFDWYKSDGSPLIRRYAICYDTNSIDEKCERFFTYSEYDIVKPFIETAIQFMKEKRLYNEHVDIGNGFTLRVSNEIGINHGD